MLICLLLGMRQVAESAELQDYRIPVLVYHRFGETVSDSMTVSLARFESQLVYLRDSHYEIIPLRRLVQNRLTGALVLGWFST